MFDLIMMGSVMLHDPGDKWGTRPILSLSDDAKLRPLAQSQHMVAD